ncbi:hypothetical protein U1Q18_003466, partial [Sarracenia purpurea var. burkii]
NGVPGARIQQLKSFCLIKVESILEEKVTLVAKGPMVAFKVMDQTASPETQEASTVLPECEQEDDEETEDGDVKEKMKMRRMNPLKVKGALQQGLKSLQRMKSAILRWTLVCQKLQTVYQVPR